MIAKYDITCRHFVIALRIFFKALKAAQSVSTTQYDKIHPDFPIYLNNDNNEGKAIKL